MVSGKRELIGRNGTSTPPFFAGLDMALKVISCVTLQAFSCDFDDNDNHDNDNTASAYLCLEPVCEAGAPISVLCRLWSVPGTWNLIG